MRPRTDTVWMRSTYRWRAQIAPVATPPFVEIDRASGVAIEVVLQSST